VSTKFEETTDLIGYLTVFDEIGLGTGQVRTLLDYGCGPGTVTARAAEVGDAEIFAVDGEERLLDVARREHAHPRVTYHLLGDAGLAFLPDDSVDAAMSCSVFVSGADPAEVRADVAEIHRVLRPGARYAVLDTNPDADGVRLATFQACLDVFSEAGFTDLRVREPLLDALPDESTRPPFLIVSGAK